MSKKQLYNGIHLDERFVNEIVKLLFPPHEK